MMMWIRRCSLWAPAFLLLTAVGSLAPARARAECDRPTALADLSKKIEAARQAYFLAEFWQSLEHLKTSEQQLTCLSGVVPPEDLRALYALKGTVHINVDQAVEARQALTRAVAISPSMEWDQELGNRSKTLFRELTAAQVTRTPGALLLSWRGTEQYAIAVDGRQAASGKTLDGLYPGEHFIQYQKGTGGWAGRWVNFQGAPPWVPALTADGEVVVERADTSTPGGLMSHVKWKPGLYIAGGTGLVALTSGSVSLWSRSQANTVLDNLGPTETLPDSYDTYATRANRSGVVALSAAGAALISGGLAFILPVGREKKVEEEEYAHLNIIPLTKPGERGVVVTMQWRW